MDKVLSARIDESVVRRIGMLAEQLKTTKKKVIEDAVDCYARQVAQERREDVLDRTFGAWRREEPATETVAAARAAFRESLQRRQA